MPDPTQTGVKQLRDIALQLAGVVRVSNRRWASDGSNVSSSVMNQSRPPMELPSEQRTIQGSLSPSDLSKSSSQNVWRQLVSMTSTLKMERLSVAGLGCLCLSSSCHAAKPMQRIALVQASFKEPALPSRSAMSKLTTSDCMEYCHPPAGRASGPADAQGLVTFSSTCATCVWHGVNWCHFVKMISVLRGI